MQSMVHMLETDDKEQIKICAGSDTFGMGGFQSKPKVLVSREGESQIGQED